MITTIWKVKKHITVRPQTRGRHKSHQSASKSNVKFSSQHSIHWWQRRLKNNNNDKTIVRHSIIITSTIYKQTNH
eukprot:m.33417 g.33417  ORF g.33417 m.33417 type:complete len:75 (-) comp9858_c3_seq12:1918-2142(-)